MRIGYNREKTDEYGKRFGVIILAAGLSSRMQAFKPLLPVDGRPALEGLIETAKAAGLEDITVVTGHQREKLQPVLARCGAAEAYNEDYESGMFSSIKVGLAKAIKAQSGSSDQQAKEGAQQAKDGYLLMPVDCPLISVSVLRAVMDAVPEEGATSPAAAPAASEAGTSEPAAAPAVPEAGASSPGTSEAGTSEPAAAPSGPSEPTKPGGEAFAVAVFEGKKGHPIYIPASRAGEILESDGTGGLAAITDKYADSMIRVETGEEGCILDMDTPEGYEDIKRFVAKGFAREKLELLTARKRIILVRHGETKQHAEPMFIGQYDVPLSEEGRAQAQAAGEEIVRLMAEDVEAELLGMDKFGKEPMPAIERIYASDLSRAMETADIIAKAINKAFPHLAEMTGGPVRIKRDPGLREISLGSWDGRPIREVAEECPEEYERRGKDIFAFKMRGAESFYDMQYRVKAAFRNILRNDDAKDIIIIAHSGVIRALENSIRGMQVSDPWDPVAKGELRMLEPFPEQQSERVHGDKPMNMNDLTMEAVLEMYE